MAMNILITNDDGPEATGLAVLIDSARRAHPHAQITVITPESVQVGAAMSVTPPWEVWKTAEAVETVLDNGIRTFALPLTPQDVIARAFLKREDFHPHPWDLVLCGVNHGLNLGTDIYLSGTVCQAMAAASFYGCAAFAFSFNVPDVFDHRLDRSHFSNCEKIVSDFLRKTSPNAGEAFNVNIPAGPARGYRKTKVAHYSYFRRPEVKLVPRAQNEDSDITGIQAGYVTISELQLRVNPQLRYA